MKWNNFKNEELFDLCCFSIILIIISIFLLDSYSTSFNISLVKKSSTNECSQHDGNYKACTKAQENGMGCAWYSDCNACSRSGDDVKVVCK